MGITDHIARESIVYKPPFPVTPQTPIETMVVAVAGVKAQIIAPDIHDSLNAIVPLNA